MSNVLPQFSKKLSDVFAIKRNRLIALSSLVGVLVLAMVLAYFYAPFSLTGQSTFEVTATAAKGATVNPATHFLVKSSGSVSPGALRGNLKFEPALEFDVNEKGWGGHTFEVNPKQPLKDETVYALAVSPPLAKKPQGWAYQVKAPFMMIASSPGNQAVDVPLEVGIELTFNRALQSGEENNVTIEPAVKGVFELHNETIVFVPKEPLQERTLYTVKIKKGLTAASTGETLEFEGTVAFETGEAKQSVETPFLSLSGYKTLYDFQPTTQPIFQVSGEGVNEAPIKVYRYPSSDDFIAAHDAYRNEEYAWSKFHRKNKLAVKEELNVLTTNIRIERQEEIGFIRLPKTLPEGFYLLQLSQPNRPVEMVWFQVSPLIGFTGQAADQSIVWVKDGVSKHGVSGAEVSYQGIKVASTDDKGTVLFTNPSALKNIPEDQSFKIPFLKIRKDVHELLLPAAIKDLRGPAVWWNVMTVDKPVYRPSDSLNFWGVAKRRDGTNVSGNQLVIQLKDAYSYEGESPVYAESKVSLSPFSTFAGSLSFSGVRPGYYEAVAKLGDEVVSHEGVNIQTYIKPAYSLSLVPDKKAAAVGDTVKYSVSASFYDGTPISRLLLRYMDPVKKEKQTIRLDEQGKGTISVVMAKTTAIEPFYYSLTVGPEESEEGEIAVTSSTLVFPSRLHLDVTSQKKQAETTFAVRVNSIDLTKGNTDLEKDYVNGPVPNQTLDIRVVRTEYKEREVERRYDPLTKFTYPIFAYDKIDKEVFRETRRTDERGEISFSWTAEKDVSFLIELSAPDARGDKAGYQETVWGSFESAGLSDSLGINLVNAEQEKDFYKFGDPIHLLVNKDDGVRVTPKPEGFLYVRAVNGKLSLQVSSDPEYRDTFKEEYIPNVEIYAIWFEGKRFYVPPVWHSNGRQILSMDTNERALDIVMTNDKERYRPQDQVALTLQVKDKKGSPKKAEVTVAVIDEALSAFGGQRDAVASLYEAISTDMRFYSSHENPLEGGAEGGGCFLKGTSIRTPQGEKNIEEIKEGDAVITRERPDSERLITAYVERVTSHPAYEYIVINGRLRLTPNHRLFVNGAWQTAGSLKEGDTLITFQGTYEQVRSLEHIKEGLKVYNIEIKGTHTFFADGIYVHNQEKAGGGAIRKDFKDAIAYKTLTTDNNGYAQMNFKVPDNLTSWRATANAVTEQLYFGQQSKLIPVGIPFFVDATLNTSYLTGDSIGLRLRVFGTDPIPAKIVYRIEDKSGGFPAIERTAGSVANIDIGKLSPGMHELVITAKSDTHSDTLIRNVLIKDTYLTKQVADQQRLTLKTSTKVKGSEQGLTLLTLCGCSQAEYSNLLTRATWASSRVDEQVAAMLSKDLLKTYFNEEYGKIEDNDLTVFQKNTGGMAVVSFSGEDPYLSALIANAMQNQSKLLLNRSSLKDYLRASKLRPQALYGLSAYRDLVLDELHAAKDDKSLNMLDKAYVVLALQQIGAKDMAREYFQDAIRPQLLEQDTMLMVRGMQSHDDDIRATTLLALYAAKDGHVDTERLVRYAVNNEPARTTLTLERVLLLQSYLPSLPAENASITYQSGSERVSKELKPDAPIHLALTPGQVKDFSVTLDKGDAMAVSSYEERFDNSTKLDSEVGVTRWYEVNGKKTTTVKEGDLVKVVLSPRFSRVAQDGTYEVIDYLPSGLRIVTTSPSDEATGSATPSYPSYVTDQKAVFNVYKDEKAKPFFYYARVVSHGIYKADRVMIQSIIARDSLNLSESDVITIQ